MRRRQLVEIEDLAWCPRAVRDGGTDWLGFLANGTRAFLPLAPRIRQAMEATGTDEVLDLCSGGGGPWLTLQPALAAAGRADVRLSDRFPNTAAFKEIQSRSGGGVGFHDESIDATNVPARFRGVRTMFNAFHHFPPEAAVAILADAVRKRRAIVIAESVDHRGAGLAAMPFQLPAVLLLTPLVRPFRWSRLALTYVLPLIPLLVLFDGTVSMLRLYLPDELRELVARVPGHESFTWDIGSTPIRRAPVGLTHLIGLPRGGGGDGAERIAGVSS